LIDITNLKARVDLVQVMTDRGLELKPKGHDLFARCPFHPDDTPSLSVNPKKQLWSCFGCGAGGDVFTFVQRFHGVDFIGAVKILLGDDLAGIDPKDLEALDQERQKEESGDPQQEETLGPGDPRQIDRQPQEILDRVLNDWQKSLSRSRKAQGYLERRGLWCPQVLRPLSVGYSTGNLPQSLPETGKIVRQLKQMGILNKNGNEFFYDRIVVPLFDETGVLTSVYGRSVNPKSPVPHLYLPGPRRGVFNPAGIQDGQPVILTESILDAISLLVLGVLNVTASFGANGFTSDLRAQLIRKGVPRVDCVYDSDPTGDDAADQLAHNLVGHGIEVRRVELDVKDPNEFLMAGGTREAFLEAVEKARTLLVSSSSVTAATTSSVDSGSSGDGGLSFTFGDRTYRVEGEPSRGSGALRVTLKVSREGKTFIDTVNLYSDRARAGLISKLNTVFRDQVKKNLIEEDLFSLIDELEARVQLELGQEEKKAPMTASERHEAQTFLRRPDLIEAILDDLTKLGLVGENENKLLAYPGLRVGELCALDLADLDLAQNEVLVRQSKSGHPRRVPVGEVAHDALDRYLEEGRPAILETQNGTRTSALFVSARGKRLPTRSRRSWNTSTLSRGPLPPEVTTTISVAWRPEESST